MNQHVFLILLPYMFSLGISIVVAVYCLRKQNVPGANSYAWLAIVQSAWVAALVMRLSERSIAEKIFWTNIEWLAIFSIPYIYPIFTAQFIGYKPSRLKWLRLVLGIVPIGMTILLLTDGYHHQIYPNPHLVPGDPYPELGYDLTALIRWFGAYGLLVVFGTVIALARRLIRPHHLYRSQILAIIIASLIPSFTTILALTRVTETDTTPLSFIVRNLVVLWALSRYHLFDIVPVARDTVIENINDPVVVVDTLNRVIDINPAAAKNISLPASQVIGQSFEVVFSDWPELVEKFQDVSWTKTQITAKIHRHTHYFDLSISPLYDRHARLIGRIFISREITAHAKLEQRLQRLNTDLEGRVRERTEELASAYDTTLQGWAKALEFRDKEAEGHSQRVTEATMSLASALNIPEDQLVHIRRGVLLHDIGKMAIPDEILRKGLDLSETEKEIVSQHPLVAYELLSPIPYLEKALDIPYCHHERWDGNGYPRGLKGQEIPLAARIFAVIDVWDALQSARPYRDAWPKEKIVEYMRAQAEFIFDPDVLRVFLDLVEQGRLVTAPGD